MEIGIMPRTANANMWNHKCHHCNHSDEKLIAKYKPKDGQNMVLVECGKCHNNTLIRFSAVDDMTTSFKVS